MQASAGALQPLLTAEYYAPSMLPLQATPNPSPLRAAGCRQWDLEQVRHHNKRDLSLQARPWTLLAPRLSSKSCNQTSTVGSPPCWPGLGSHCLNASAASDAKQTAEHNAHSSTAGLSPRWRNLGGLQVLHG